MEAKRVLCVYFSPSGTTKATVDMVARELGGQIERFDLLRKPDCLSHLSFEPGDVLVVGMPVYAGRVPVVCREALKSIHSAGVPAVLLAVYGNRHYDDALLEMADTLEASGFSVLAGGAVVAQHSIFPNVGKGRPDASDILKLQEFAEVCRGKLASLNAGRNLVHVTMPGNQPYREVPPGNMLTPRTNSNCNQCGVCSALCPTHAILAADPRKTDKSRCITCMACVSACPQQARALGGFKYQVGKRLFAKKCAQRKEPEWYY